jgi:hypothetical protein
MRVMTNYAVNISFFGMVHFIPYLFGVVAKQTKRLFGTGQQMLVG